MATEKGSIWGDEVVVPKGETINPSAAAHVKPAGSNNGDPNNNGNPGNTGNDDGGGDDGDETRTAPVITMPDGTEMSFEDYAKENDPFAEQRAELEKKEAKLDGYAEAMRAGNGDPNKTSEPGGDDPKKHPLLEDNPLLEEIEIPEDHMMSEETLQVIQKHNNAVKYAKEQNQHIVGMEEAFEKKIKVLSDEVSDRFFNDDMARVTAQTGVTEQEIAAAFRETGVSDIDTLATIVMGKKARETAADDIGNKADEERRSNAGNIGGSNRNTGNGDPKNDEEGRGVKDWRNKEEVGKAYNFRATD